MSARRLLIQASAACAAGLLVAAAHPSARPQATAAQGAASAGAPVSQTASAPSLHELLDGYWAGRFDVVSERFARGADVAAMVPKARAWIDSSAARGWQFASLVLLLDLANAAVTLPDPAPDAARDLVRLAREEITAKHKPEDGPPIDPAAELLWHQTALALLQAQDAWADEGDYLNAIARRFQVGTPAQIWLARGIALEQRYLPSDPPAGGASSGLSNKALEALDEAVRDYDRAARDEALRTEASARAASVLVRLDRHRDALRRLDLAGDPDSDVTLASWLHDLRGRALAGTGEHAQAAAELEQALQLAPDSTAARKALADELHALGRDADAEALDLRAPAFPQDPWRTFANGNARFIPDWMARLRGTLAVTMASKDGAPTRPPVLVLLDRYAAHDYDFTVDALVGSPLKDFAEKFQETANRWIAEGDATEAGRRGLVVATVALEAARARGLIEWPAAQVLVESACARLRSNPVKTEAERLWLEATAALMEGAVAGTALEIHVTHALERFPDDPPLVMARAVAAELRAGPDRRTDDGTKPPLTSPLNLAAKRFADVAGLPEYRDEANLRLGYTALRRSQFDDALAPLAIAAASTNPFIRYLGCLLRGRALEHLDRWDEAIASYRAAVAIQPTQTAEVALATALGRTGRRVEAAELAELVLRRPAPAFDPWLEYGQGDFRFWSRMISNLRAAIQ
jgi:tetratricopeptide (TPR) repeat protein